VRVRKHAAVVTLLALAALSCHVARAESLIYVTASTSGTVTNLGSPPAGTLLVVAASGATVSTAAGGTLTPTMLLPLAALAGWRRRRRTRA
jgi:hypothetical protein